MIQTITNLDLLITHSLWYYLGVVIEVIYYRFMLIDIFKNSLLLDTISKIHYLFFIILTQNLLKKLNKTLISYFFDLNILAWLS